MNGHVQVARDGAAFVVSDEEDPNSQTYQLCLHGFDPDDETWSIVGAFAEGSLARGLQPAFDGSRMRLPLTFSFDIASDGTLVVAYVDRVMFEGGVCPPCDLPFCPPCFTFVDHVFVAENPEAGDPASWEYSEIAPGVVEYQSQPALSAEGDHRAVSYYETVTPAGERPGSTTSIRVMSADQFPALASDWIPFSLSQVPFEPCPTLSGDYFGDYMGIGLLDGDLVDLFFTAWADARDGCLEQENAGNVYHQHTYGAISP